MATKTITKKPAIRPEIKRLKALKDKILALPMEDKLFLSRELMEDTMDARFKYLLKNSPNLDISEEEVAKEVMVERRSRRK